MFMHINTIVTYIALILSIISIALIVIAIIKVGKYVKTLIDELGLCVVTRKKHRRIKRYILVKFFCLDNNLEDFSKHVEQSINKFLGPLLRYKCSINIISYKPDKKRAIIRVRGEAICVTYTLLALTIQHLKENMSSCIAIPIKTSGLLSRLRRRYLR